MEAISPSCKACKSVLLCCCSGDVGTSGNTLALVPAPESSSHTGSGALAVRRESTDAPPSYALDLKSDMAQLMQMMQHSVVPAVAASNDYLDYKVGPCIYSCSCTNACIRSVVLVFMLTSICAESCHAHHLWTMFCTALHCIESCSQPRGAYMRLLVLFCGVSSSLRV